MELNKIYISLNKEWGFNLNKLTIFRTIKKSATEFAIILVFEDNITQTISFEDMKSCGSELNNIIVFINDANK